MVYTNPTSLWASAPLRVQNNGSDRFRFTVDLRSVNSFTIRHKFPMQNVENEMHTLVGSRCYAILGLSHGYWKLPLEKSSQSSQSFIKQDGIYSPTRLLQGSRNSVLYLQSTPTSKLPTKLTCQLLYWIEDVFLYSATLDKLLTVISRFFELCKELNPKLHPAKCILYSKRIIWYC